MQDSFSKVGTGGMTRKERDLRSHLVRLCSRYGFLHATLNVRERSCGKSNCKCTTGEKHSSLYVVWQKDGELRQVCVPRAKEIEVRQWVKRYQEMQELLDEVSNFYWSKIQKKGE